MLHDTTAILLAAGESKRFGQNNKLLENINGKSILHRCVDTLLDSNVQRVVVVTGYNHAAIEHALKAYQSQKLSTCFNPFFERGQSSSVKAGINHCNDSSAILVCLADMPHVKKSTVNCLIQSSQDNPDSTILAPQFRGKRGNPVLFKKSGFDSLLSLNGDTGAKHYIEQHPELLRLVSVEDAGIHHDYDAPEDFHTGPSCY